MQALRAYLHLRFRLLARLLREIGALRLVLLGPMLGAALGRALVVGASHPQGQWAIPVAVFFLLLSAHRQRDDLRFLATAAPDFRRWLAVEYALLAVPTALVLLGFRAWLPALFTLLLAPLVALAPPARESCSTRQRPRSLFRSEAFEWVSGMRAAWAWLLWPALLAGAIWQRAAPLGPILALTVWLLVLLGCYGTPEPLTMLALAQRTAGQFLRRRLLLGLGYAGLTAAPLVWILAVGPAGLGAAVAVGVAFLSLLVLIMLTKYAFYPNALHIRTTQALVVALALPGHPVYPVLLLVAAGGLVWQSRRNLNRGLGSG